MGKTEYIFTVTDKLGRTVSLSKGTYDNHIISGHPEMMDHQDAISDTLTNPTYIIESNKIDGRSVYIGNSEDARYPKRSIKTIVSYADKEGSGSVVTSFYTRDGDVTKEGKVIYEKSED